MQQRSDLWKELAADPSSRLETVAEIGGATYASISAPVISRALMTDALSVGNCSSATLQFSILTQGMVIPQSAEIIIRKRLSDGTRFSEWLPAGTFYISQRKDDKVTNRLITLTCYDAMRKANAAYPLYEGDESTWPKSMRTVISEIAGYVGVEVDERTWTHIRDGPDYVIPRPEGLRMQKVLAHIAAVYGGNWYITQDNRLRFVPLLSGSNAQSSADRLNITATLGKVKTGTAITVTGVSIGNGRETFTAGNHSGHVLEINRNPYASQQIAEDLAAQFAGLVYAPYTIEKGVYDPAAELGDYVISRSDVRSVLCVETARLNLSFRGDISAPFKSEIADEYPYRSRTEELDDELQELVTVVADKASIDDLYALRAQIDNLSVSDIKTGVIHSNDYQYAPYPRAYPSRNLYPGRTLYPSNGEYVLRGFAIDFSSGVIRGAFYSEQIIALQEIAESYALRLSSLTERLTSVENGLNAVSQKDTQQDGEISTLQTTVSGHGMTISEHSGAISSLQGTVATQSGDIATNQTAISGLQNNVSGLTTTVGTHGSDISTLKTDVQELRAIIQDLRQQINIARNGPLYPRGPAVSA